MNGLWFEPPGLPAQDAFYQFLCGTISPQPSNAVKCLCAEATRYAFPTPTRGKLSSCTGRGLRRVGPCSLRPWSSAFAFVFRFFLLPELLSILSPVLALLVSELSLSFFSSRAFARCWSLSLFSSKWSSVKRSFFNLCTSSSCSSSEPSRLKRPCRVALLDSFTSNFLFEGSLRSDVSIHNECCQIFRQTLNSTAGKTIPAFFSTNLSLTVTLQNQFESCLCDCEAPP